MYQQSYDPMGNVFLSTVVAAIPIAVLLYFIALHAHRDKQGVKHLGISAPYAAFYGVIAAFLVSCLAFKMPLASAVSAFALGTLSGFLGIIWIVLAAMFLYTMSVVSGKFEVVKESIVHISFDRRLQCVLIAFSFGAIIEGTSGFGTPVAIAGAVMVGLGFKPFQSAVLNLLANTAPVAWGAIGTPIVTLAAVSGLDEVTLSAMAGRQLPWVSILVPFWLVATFVKMEGGTWKEAFEVWPAALCAGVSFALMQFYASGTNEFHLMTDVVAGVFSVICTALFLRFVWHPKTRFLLRAEREALAKAGKNTATATVDGTTWKYKYSFKETAYAWLPWVILIICCALWGMPEFKKYLNGLFSGITFATTLFGSNFAGTLSLPVWDMPSLHNLVQRMPPVVPPGAKPEAARFAINWLSAAGTGVFVAALLSGLVLRQPVEGILYRHCPPHEDSGSCHRPGAGSGVPHPLLRHRRGARPGFHRRRLHVSILCGVSGLVGRLSHRLRHGVQRSVWQPAANHGSAVAPERDFDRGNQLDRWCHGQDDRCPVHHGRLCRML